MDYLCEINFARSLARMESALSLAIERWLLKGLFEVLRLKHEIENVRFAEAGDDGGTARRVQGVGEGWGGEGRGPTCKRTAKPIPHPNSASVTVSNPISDMVIREWARKCEAFNQRDSLSSSVPRFSPRRPCELMNRIDLNDTRVWQFVS